MILKRVELAYQNISVRCEEHELPLLLNLKRFNHVTQPLKDNIHPQDSDQISLIITDGDHRRNSQGGDTGVDIGGGQGIVVLLQGGPVPGPDSRIIIGGNSGV